MGWGKEARPLDASGEVLSSTGCAKLEGLPIRAAGEFGKQISFLRKI